MFVPVVPRPWLMGTAPFRWLLEYFSVKVAYQSGAPLPPKQYIYLFMPHGLYPFSGACAAVSKLRDVFPKMRIGVAPIALRIPVIRQLMHWIDCMKADKASLEGALAAGNSICLFPGGIAEMVRTEMGQERILLKSRKGFARIALEHGTPIVPVYVFGQSILWSHLKLPAWVERLSRWLQVSIILPYGRFGMLVPRKKSLLYAIGNPIAVGSGGSPPTAEAVDATHSAVVAAVQELYDLYKGVYGWQNRRLLIE